VHACVCVCGYVCGCVCVCVADLVCADTPDFHVNKFKTNSCTVADAKELSSTETNVSRVVSTLIRPPILLVIVFHLKIFACVLD